jgi:tetratricopeptide (TPR) repeat protein
VHLAAPEVPLHPRMKPAALALLLLAAVGGCSRAGGSPSRPPSPEPRLALARQPDWLTPYRPEQKALLASQPSSPVTTPARPVYPLLDHFTYVRAEPFSEVRARLAARTVLEHIEASPLLYVAGRTEPGLANLIAQYGPDPPVDPDPWIKVVRKGAHYRLEWARPNTPARVAVGRANRAVRAGDLPRAVVAMRRATFHSPGVPGLWTALAALLVAVGDDAGAEAALREALVIDDRYFEAYLGLANLYARRGAAAQSIAAAVRALALYPVSPRAWGAAELLAPVRPRPEPPGVFIEVGHSGAIHVGAPGGKPETTYALCRAGVRFEPELRARLLQVPSGSPYRLTAGEELLCLEAMLGTYASTRTKRVPKLEALLGIAQQGELGGYVMFEIVGQHRPEWLRLAPDDQLRSVVAYVKRMVMGRQE